MKLDAPSAPASSVSDNEGEGLDTFADAEGEEEEGLDAFSDAEGDDDKPFDDTPFDAGVEADEDSDPEKYIQQLAGKLGTSLRKYNDERGEPDLDLEKYAINSVISASHTAKMDDEDKKDIIKKVESSGAADDVETEEPIEDEPAGEEELDLGGEEGLEEENVIQLGNDIELSEDEMMIQNLKNLKADAEEILKLSKQDIDKKLKGHSWAQDHISTSADDAEEVADFLTTEEEMNEIHYGDGAKAIAADIYSTFIEGKKYLPTAKQILDAGIAEKYHIGNPWYIIAIVERHTGVKLEPGVVKEGENLNLSEKNGTFAEKEDMHETVQPEVKPDVKPSEPKVKPSRRTRRIWEVRPSVKPKPKMKEEGSQELTLNGKVIDHTSLEVDGVDPKDYPDLVDSYFSYALYADGTELTDEELDQLGDEQADLLYQLSYEKLF